MLSLIKHQSIMMPANVDPRNSGNPEKGRYDEGPGALALRYRDTNEDNTLLSRAQVTLDLPGTRALARACPQAWGRNRAPAIRTDPGGLPDFGRVAAQRASRPAPSLSAGRVAALV